MMVVNVDLVRTDGCDIQADWNNLIGSYIGWHEPVPMVSAILPVEGNFDSYLRKCRNRYKGNVIRDARKADKEGFICEEFDWPLYIPDVVEINHSKAVRSGGQMRPAYKRSIEEMGGSPKEYTVPSPPKCWKHWGTSWGIFRPDPFYKQGAVRVDKKLLGYINLLRLGDIVLYSQFLGHGSYLRFGIMYHLHFHIMAMIFYQVLHYSGIKYVMYAGWNDGNEGLKLWKKKTCFEPVQLVTQ